MTYQVLYTKASNSDYLQMTTIYSMQTVTFFKPKAQINKCSDQSNQLVQCKQADAERSPKQQLNILKEKNPRKTKQH